MSNQLSTYIMLAMSITLLVIISLLFEFVKLLFMLFEFYKTIYQSILCDYYTIYFFKNQVLFVKKLKKF